MADQLVMFTSIDGPHAEVPSASIEVQIVPTGPTGLWGALARVAAPQVVGRELPVADRSSVARAPSMFDYDPASATPLGDEVLARFAS